MRPAITGTPGPLISLHMVTMPYRDPSSGPRISATLWDPPSGSWHFIWVLAYECTRVWSEWILGFLDAVLRG